MIGHKYKGAFLLKFSVKSKEFKSTLDIGDLREKTVLIFSPLHNHLVFTKLILETFLLLLPHIVDLRSVFSNFHFPCDVDDHVVTC